VTQPLISILINNYNYADYLPDAIDSALNQTYPAVEVIVVDDGSTDHSRQVLTRYGDRIKVIYQTNQGQAAAFNHGFAASRGDIICFLDADDAFYPGKAAAIAEVFRCYPGLGWCFHPLQLVTDGQPMLAPSQTSSRLQLEQATQHALMDAMRSGKLGEPFPFTMPATSAMCFGRWLLADILPMPEGPGISLNDSYVKFAALGLSAGVALNQRWAVQRIHASNAFTLKRDPQQSAKIHLLMAYWLQRHFPQLRQFNDNLFAAALGDYRSAGMIPADEQRLIEEYIQQLSPRKQVALRCRGLFYWLKAQAVSLGRKPLPTLREAQS
jgi:glycosyltransferase involved in cell wall biosynthesis